MISKLLAIALLASTAPVGLSAIAPDEAEAQARERRVERTRTTPRGELRGERLRQREPGSRTRSSQFTDAQGRVASRDLNQRWGQTETGFFAQRNLERQYRDGTSRGYVINRDLNSETQTATRDYDAYFRDGTTANGLRTIQKVDAGLFQVDGAGVNRQGEEYNYSKTITIEDTSRDTGADD